MQWTCNQHWLFSSVWNHINISHVKCYSVLKSIFINIPYCGLFLVCWCDWLVSHMTMTFVNGAGSVCHCPLGCCFPGNCYQIMIFSCQTLSCSCNTEARRAVTSSCECQLFQLLLAQFSEERSRCVNVVNWCQVRWASSTCHSWGAVVSQMSWVSLGPVQMLQVPWGGWIVLDNLVRQLTLIPGFCQLSPTGEIPSVHSHLLTPWKELLVSPTEQAQAQSS